MKKTKENKAITLIALVITIIILLILAGVAIGMVTNSDGILGKARNAVDKYNRAVADEEDVLENLLGIMDNSSGGKDTALATIRSN